MFGRKPGKMLEKDRLALEDSLEFYRKQYDDLNAHYQEQLRLYERALERHNDENAKMLLACAENTQKQINQAAEQYNEIYNRIAMNSEISKRDGDKKNASIGTAVGVGTALGSLTLGALSLSQCVASDQQGLLRNKSVVRFFEQINPIRILRERH